MIAMWRRKDAAPANSRESVVEKLMVDLDTNGSYKTDCLVEIQGSQNTLDIIIGIDGRYIDGWISRIRMLKGEVAWEEQWRRMCCAPP